MSKIFNKRSFRINFSWLIFDKFFRASLNILLSIILARSLGPEDFGILSYILALVFLFTAISALGINPILTNKIIKDKKSENHVILINSYYLRFLASLICYCLFIFLINFSESENKYFLYSLILGSLIVLKSYEVLFSYFEAKSLSKYIVLSQLLGLIISFLLIIYFVYYNFNSIYIYFSLAFDAVVVFFSINTIYFLKKKKYLTLINLKILKKTISKSFPLLISTISIILYMRIDQIMIKIMIDEYSLGIYSVSVRFVEIFHFIPKIIIISILPIILISRRYKLELLRLNSIIFKISLLIVFFIFFSSDLLIEILYGKNYNESTITTKILSFSILFVFYGVVNEHWYISKNLQKYYAISVFFGAMSNIILNYLLIRQIGLIGAAYSTLITYFLIIFVFDYFNNKTRKLLKIKYESIIKL